MPLEGLWIAQVWVFFVGTCVGSFLNVVIYRLPAGLSLVRPGSRCPHCETPVRFYDNIPILSWLILRGRCRTCKGAIAVRYPLVELLTGLLAWFTWLKFGLSWAWLLNFLFIATLIAITFIDLDHRIIPDRISLPGIPIFFLAGLCLPVPTVLDAVIGMVVGGGSLLSIAWGYYLLTKREGMGGGDIKLLAMMGGFIGWQGVLFTIFAASAAGTLVGVGAMLKTRKGMRLAIPFGPFLAFGATLYLFIGNAVIHWYLYDFAA
ncbi:MAG: prepilin peptidase [Desulfosarcinaceae bacterium]|jgi:leader peptidase (prepilin peptidase)/N-methyltransferase